MPWVCRHPDFPPSCANRVSAIGLGVGGSSCLVQLIWCAMAPCIQSVHLLGSIGVHTHLLITQAPLLHCQASGPLQVDMGWHQDEAVYPLLVCQNNE